MVLSKKPKKQTPSKIASTFRDDLQTKDFLKTQNKLPCLLIFLPFISHIWTYIRDTL